MIRHLLLLVVLALQPLAVAAAQDEKLDPILVSRARDPQGLSRVIATTVDGRPATEAILAAEGIPGRFLSAHAGQVALVPDARLGSLAGRAEIASVRLDRMVVGTMDRASAAIGADWVREQLGLDGSGVGVAIVDSGVTNWHDDLGTQTVVSFIDFVDSLPIAHDDYGHGTHVAGTIAGSGYDSAGLRRGVAPGARLVVLKVLDEAGNGHISNVIAALDYAIANRTRYNIRVINLSVSSGVYESYLTDPLTLAARRAVEAGIVVVTAAGNLGQTAKGTAQAGSITSPGNAPWVITVGASNHQRTAGRSDDTVAPFSSRGPTLIDSAQKPDLLAPGVGIESLAAPGSTLFDVNADARIAGSVDTAFAPYLRLTGTSMAAPLVTGTIALMFEANPSLTPNLVKAILQFTAERRPRYDTAAQGAGSLNARGAVQLAQMLAGKSVPAVETVRWSRQILWGNERIRVGSLGLEGTAWRTDVVWGAARTPDGLPVTWGSAEADAPRARREDELVGAAQR